MPRSSRSREFQKRLILWFKKEGRKFYWRTQTLGPWQWLVLELLLKRTRAETVEKFFPSFIEKYHRPEIVVQTSDLELEKDLRFLGLQRQRRVALKRIAEKITSAYKGKVPVDYDSLLSLPHIGRYIANAILCFSQSQRRPIVDINVGRVLTRFHGLEMPKDAREKWIWELAEKMLPNRNWEEFNYALLDLGATVCRNKPKCNICYVNYSCKYSTKPSKA
ncbi:MAG: hypothetical protein ACFFCD_17805 [Promethearchaeota archaeon]